MRPDDDAVDASLFEQLVETSRGRSEAKIIVISEWTVARVKKVKHRIERLALAFGDEPLTRGGFELERVVALALIEGGVAFFEPSFDRFRKLTHGPSARGELGYQEGEREQYQKTRSPRAPALPRDESDQGLR